MSSTGMAWARRQTAPSATCKSVLILLGELSDDTGRVFRDQQYIADILQLSREAVLRNLAKLEEAGMIQREARFTAERKRMKDLIRLQISRSFTVEEPCDPESHGSESHVIESQEPCDPESHNAVIESHSKPKQELKQEITTNTPALFETPAEVVPINSASEAKMICEKIHEGTTGAWSFREALGPVKWALAQGYSADMILGMSSRIWRSGGRVLSKAVLQQAFEGIAIPGVKQPQMRVAASDLNAQRNAQLKAQIMNTTKELTE